MVLHRLLTNATHIMLFIGLIFTVRNQSTGMPNNHRHLLQASEPIKDQNAKPEPVAGSHTSETSSPTTAQPKNGAVPIPASAEVPPVDTGIIEGNINDSRRGVYHRQLNDYSFQLPVTTDVHLETTTNDEKLPVSAAGTYGNPKGHQIPNISYEDGTISEPSLESRNGPYVPQYFRPDVTSKHSMHAQPRAAVPPFPPPDGGSIREGESRGRAGSPRRIENFPPLQNQPGQEYLEAINRRTVLPLPPSTTTAKTTTAKLDAMTLPNFNVDVIEPFPVHGTENATWNSTEQTSFLPPSDNNRRMDDETLIKTHVLTTMESPPDIGTAFSLNEDFTDAHLTMKITITDPDAGDPTTAKHDSIMTTSAANFVESASKLTTTTFTSVSTIPTVNVTHAVTHSTTTVATGKTSPGPTYATEKPTTSPTLTPVPKVTAPPSTVASTQKTTSELTSRATSTTLKPTTVRPSLRRRLPSFRSTSPRPTIRRRLPRPTPMTTTVFAKSPIQLLQVDVDLEDTTLTIMPEEEDMTVPFLLPPEPTTVRRKYVMTVPPLLDFENRNGEKTEEDVLDSFTEATQVTAPEEAGIIPEGATNAIIVSGIIGGCAIVFFAILMIFCMWRQHVSRRPIYPPPESSNSSSTSSNSHGKLG